MTRQTTDQKGVVVLGATSLVARVLARAFAETGRPIVLGARDDAENARIASDINVRTGQPCYPLHFDAEAVDTHPAFWIECAKTFGHFPGGLIVCFGYMADQKQAEQDVALAKRMVEVNLLGAVSVLETAAHDFSERKEGFIATVSSVAGDRGRQSNYLYGAAKGGLSVYMQGLRNRMHHHGVPVTTLIPGFMDTPMTEGMDLPNPLVTAPERAGKLMVHAIQKRKSVAYIPGYWRLIMTVITSIPEPIFKRLRF